MRRQPVLTRGHRKSNARLSLRSAVMSGADPDRLLGWFWGGFCGVALNMLKCAETVIAGILCFTTAFCAAQNQALFNFNQMHRVGLTYFNTFSVLDKPILE